MINKEIVQRTIQVIEDYCDMMAANPSNDVTIDDMAKVGELLNFWRLYLNFIPAEEAKDE